MAKSSRFSISAVVSMIDKVSEPMSRASKSVTGFSKRMRGQFRRADVSISGVNKGINRVGGRVATRGLQGLAIGAALVAREYVKFDDAIFGATARFKAAEKPGTDMAVVMTNLRKAAREMGAQTQFSATLMAQGLDKFALAGFNSSESISILGSQVSLATVTGEDFMRVADISSDLLGAFGGAALESSKKVEMLKEMNALLAVATLSANVTMEDLFETLKTSAPIMSQMGISMKDTIAAASVLGSAGIKGSMAATAMKNIFLRLVKPTGEVNQALRELNLSQQNFVNQTGKNKGKMKGVAEIFALIGEKTKGMEDVKVARLFAGLAGLRGVAGAAVLAKNIGEVRKQLIKMGKDPQAVMEQTAKFMRQSMGNRLKALSSAATELGFKFFSAFAGKGKKGIDSLTKAILKFDVKPLVEGLKLFFIIISGVYNIIKPFIPVIITLIFVIKTLSVVTGILTLVSIPITGTVLLMSAAVVVLVGLFAYLVVKTGSVSGAFIFLGKVIMNAITSPIRNALNIIEKLLSVMAYLPGGGYFKNMSAGVGSLREKLKFNTMLPSAEGAKDMTSLPTVGVGKNMATGVEKLKEKFNFNTSLPAGGGKNMPAGVEKLKEKFKFSVILPSVASEKYMPALPSGGGKNMPTLPAGGGAQNNTFASPKNRGNQSSVITNRGIVDVNLGNLPRGSSVKQSGVISPDFKLNIGYSD